MKCRQFLMLLSSLLCGCASTQRNNLEDHADRGISGKYRISLCTEPCTQGMKPYIEGTIVLLPEPIANSSGHKLFNPDGGGFANSCYALNQLKQNEHTYAGITMHGLMTWDREHAPKIGFHLYQSADAGYRVDLDLENSTGIGYSWGAGVASIKAPHDVVAIQRIGNASNTDCLSIPDTDYFYEGDR